MITYNTFIIEIFPIIIILLAIGSFMFWAYASINSTKLYYYLREHKKIKWKKLFFFNNLNMGADKMFNGYHYIKNDEDINNKNIRFYKERARFGIKWALRTFYLLLIYIALVIITVIVLDYAFGIKV
ncbi:MAG: hypothetical protein KJ623_04160 [Nanoarchaeota archaeon]|nr:hypothetical protein [Nanoarchaeota archaeon]MBU0962685.1 hypothetical protein [Nanoarchaeota archaeon]